MTTARQRLLRIRLGQAWHPAATKRQLVAAAVALTLGFGSVAAWRASHSDTALAVARPEQLLSVLDSLNSRQQRLEAEQRQLAVTRQKLESGSNAAAVTEARKRLAVLNTLAGTTPVTGPGLTLVIADPDQLVPSSMLLDAVQELRDAGAEAISIGSVRVVARTWFADVASGGINVAGRVLKPPYTVTAIGDGATMRTALGIPGGVIESVKGAGGSVRVSVGKAVTITAVVPTRR
ncbi:MAG: DUF881 domain-containing protein [Actinobacteria bacterium]|nr:DUF881 domain-containing protein [Actinomycetota bacterium]